MRFFDEYTRFYDTTATLLKPNRFEQRWRMIFEKNAGLLRGSRVLDLASHDGRWTFASLKAGATYVAGVEARPELVQRAVDTFAHYWINPATYSFVCQDAATYLARDRLPRFDVVLNLGFFYHTMRHLELLENMARTGAKVFIIDTAVLTMDEPIIQVRVEDVNDPRNAVDHRRTGGSMVPVGVASRSALFLMLDYVGYNCTELNWRGTIDDFSECEDYLQGDRATFVATRR
jgi:hypothetical protein